MTNRYHRSMTSRFGAARLIAALCALTVGVVGVGVLSTAADPDPTRTAGQPAGTARTTQTDLETGVLASARMRTAAVTGAVVRPTGDLATATAERLRVPTATTGMHRLAAAAQRKARAQALLQKRAARANTPFSLTLASFNVLGSNHTRPGADADHFAPGRVRIEWANEVVHDLGFDIVGFSEIQGDQLSAFTRLNTGKYAVWPGTALGYPGIPTSMAWRTDRFSAVETSYITIPFMNQKRHMPVVRLRELATGREFYAINAHNAPQGRQAERNAAMRIEIAEINRLRTQARVPVFFFGDLNEKENALCKVTTQTDLVAASPTGNLTGCTGFRGMRLDWLFGSDVTFERYTQDRSPIVSKITDHAVVHARATVS